MNVTLSDPMVRVDGWNPALDAIGAYTLRKRKTPGEMKEERNIRRAFHDTRRINPMHYIDCNVIEHVNDNPNVAIFLPGLWPRVKAELDKLGIAYTITDRRNQAIRPQIDVDALQGVEFRETQDLALALIATSDCGVIEATTAYGKSFLIGVVCRAFPTLRILICTSSTTVVSTLYEYLCKQVPGEVGILMGGKDTTMGKRVVVSTLRSLPKIPREGPQLVLVDECHDVGATQSGRDLMNFCYARRFGFSASPFRNDGSQLVLESLFGPTILKMTYEEAVNAGMVTPMKYLMLPCRGGPHMDDNTPDTILKRYSYWANTYRNKVIQALVYDIKNVFDGQILIMAATLEHCILLHQLLPWFTVAYYGNMNMESLRERFPKSKYPNIDLNKYKMKQNDLERMRNAFAKGTLRYVISTTVFRQGVNFVHLRILIRADGTTSSIAGIQIPGRLSRLDKDKECAYLIDVEDQFSVWASNRAKSREKLYKEQKWIKTTKEELLDDLRRQACRNAGTDTGTGPGQESPGTAAGG